jgi:hypothetical protein
MAGGVERRAPWEKMLAIDFTILFARPPVLGVPQRRGPVQRRRITACALARFGMQDCGRGIDSLAI